MTKTCYIAAYSLLDVAYIGDLIKLIEEELGWKTVFELSDKPDVILYAGGQDISPQLYGEKPGEKTQTPWLARDGMEIYAYQYSQLIAEHPVWNIGLCRGMQLLTILNGGKLEQHVEGHDTVTKGEPEATHALEYFGPNKQDTYGVVVNSYHHQMIRPPANGLEKHNPYTVLCKTVGMLSDPEAIAFPKTKSLGVQWHPEWSKEGAGSMRMFKRIIEDFVLAEKAA